MNNIVGVLNGSVVVRYVRPVLRDHRPVVHLDQNLLMVEEVLISYVVSSLNLQEKFFSSLRIYYPELQSVV
jgi:hypothetical protein